MVDVNVSVGVELMVHVNDGVLVSWRRGIAWPDKEEALARLSSHVTFWTNAVLVKRTFTVLFEDNAQGSVAKMSMHSSGSNAR